MAWSMKAEQMLCKLNVADVETKWHGGRVQQAGSVQSLLRPDPARGGRLTSLDASFARCFAF